jgi:hypothetical protein
MEGMETESAKYSVGGNCLEEVFFKLAVLLAKHGWPGFRVTNYKKSQKYEIVLPGGPRFTLKNGLTPLEVRLRFKIYPLKETEGDRNRQKSVFDYSNIPYGMRLARGFAILSGNKHDL